jgi:hypothetical protein
MNRYLPLLVLISFIGFLLAMCIWGVVSGVVNPFIAAILIVGEIAVILAKMRQSIIHNTKLNIRNEKYPHLSDQDKIKLGKL